ncbi:glutamate receptor 2.7-like [Telopea speciosissima]|uniref:glutamate receptor 2.7-like n=1 Tax=Telopea speciosissima TaxID=54955 RepID=UPI001CC3F6AD|nr:glutamate receptor 2.7-like [Telopea speciosissima]
MKMMMRDGSLELSPERPVGGGDGDDSSDSSDGGGDGGAMVPLVVSEARVTQASARSSAWGCGWRGGTTTGQGAIVVGRDVGLLVPSIKKSLTFYAALDLIKNVGVQAIIGPQTSEEAEFLAKMGSKAHVPIISFSAISSSLSPTQFPYFIRFAQNDSSQIKAIAAVLKAYEYKEVTLIHDNTHSGTAAIPYLIDGLQEIGTHVLRRIVLHHAMKGSEIEDILRELGGKSTRGVFIVHLSLSLGSQFFLHVKEMGMMKSSGFSDKWIIMSGLTDLMRYMEPSLLSSMNDVIGIKTRVPLSGPHRRFMAQWRKQFGKDHSKERLQLNVYGLWAYDATFVTAKAVNRASLCLNGKPPCSPLLSESKVSDNSSSTDLFKMSISQMGSEILKHIKTTRYANGVSGEIHLVNGELQSSSFEIVNVKEKSQNIGYWNPKDGLFWSLSSIDTVGKNFHVVQQARSVLDTTSSDNVLKIGVPIKTTFPEFINISRSSNDKKPIVTGFSYEVFENVMKSLNYTGSYEFFPYENENGDPKGDYNELIQQVYHKEYDAVIGDITILANRSKYVGLTQPYTVSGVRMVVPIKEDDDTGSLWWFMKPLTTELWLTTISIIVLKGFLVWIFEHGKNPEFQGTTSELVGKILSYSFSIYVFSNQEKLQSNYSRFIVSLWTFAVFILVSSYTANLTSILTVEKLQPTVTNLDTLYKDRKYVGYQDGSFVFDLLKSRGFEESRLRRLFTQEEYANALANGSVSAIVDEIPYINIFLSKYCRQFTIAGPTYRTGGFGFVFTKDFPMLENISNAVLNFSEGDHMNTIEKKWFGNEACAEPLASNVTSSRLHLHSFRSIYIIVGVTSILALILFFLSFVYKSIIEMRKTSGQQVLWWVNIMRCYYFHKKEPPKQSGQPTSGELEHQISEGPTSSYVIELTSNNNEGTNTDRIKWLIK